MLNSRKPFKWQSAQRIAYKDMCKIAYLRAVDKGPYKMLFNVCSATKGGLRRIAVCLSVRLDQDVSITEGKIDNILDTWSCIF